MPSGASRASVAFAAPPSASWRSDVRLRRGRLVAVAAAGVPRPRRSGGASRVLAPAPRHPAFPCGHRRSPFACRAAHGLRLAVPRLPSASPRRRHAWAHGALLRPAPEPRRIPTRARSCRATCPTSHRPRRRKEIRLVHADAAAFLEASPPGASTGSRSRTSWTEPTPLISERLVAAVERAAAPDAVMVLSSFREAPADAIDQPCCRRPRDALGHRRRAAAVRSSTNAAAMQADLTSRRSGAASAGAIALPRPTSIVTRMNFAASPERVWDGLMFYEQIGERAAAAPAPATAAADRNARVRSPRSVTKRTCLYERGHLLKRVTHIEPCRHYGFEVVEQHLAVGGGFDPLGRLLHSG